MCGIAGLIRFNQAIEKSEIEEITSTLAHRGPDGTGIWCEGNVAVGHRRLSIIDLALGTQPMSNEDGLVRVTFNGEIYNYKELREELIGKGHQFRTLSDTEVIVHGYEEWSDACVERFRGMFAFGIIDQNNKRLFLARDHLGIKPLVYYQNSDCFAFASEIQALRKIKGIVLDIDLEAIDEYLWLQYIPAPRSIFRQVRKLLPGHRMSVNFDGRITGPVKYWDLEFKPNFDRTEDEWLDALDHTLRQSVKAHLVSDVPFGAFLSGGVDSSAVVAYMAQILDKPVKTFTIGFSEESFSEIKYAESVSKQWHTEHHVEIVSPDDLAILPELVKHYGEPFGDSSAVPTYYVSKMARQYVPMVLSGDGGDEAFGGYHTYIAWMKYLSGELYRNRPHWKRLLLPIAQKLFPFRYTRQLSGGDTLGNWLCFIHYLPVHLRQKLWRPEFRTDIRGKLDFFESAYQHAKHYDPVGKVQYLDLKTYLPFAILNKVDIASMMNSLEVRTPWVDKEVMEFAATVPESLRLIKKDGEWFSKLIFKKLLRKYYPEEFLNRKKMGFSIPLCQWFSARGLLRNEVKERLLNTQSALLNYFDTKAIYHLIEANREGPVWLLLFLEEWLRQNKV